jgi:RHS repeat-associated protein
MRAFSSPIATTFTAPFGMVMEGRSYMAGSGYRYGFNGKEKDSEGLGGGCSTYDYGFRIYNPAIGKFLSVDPLTNFYPWYTPYQFAGNMPIWKIDLDGLEQSNSKANKETTYEDLNFLQKALFDYLVFFIGYQDYNNRNGGWVGAVTGTYKQQEGDEKFQVLDGIINGFTIANVATGGAIDPTEVNGTGSNTVLRKSTNTIDDALTLTRPILKPTTQKAVKQAPKIAMTVAKGMSKVEKINTRKNFVISKYISAIKTYGEEHIDWTKNVLESKLKGSTGSDGRRIVQWRDPANSKASPFFTYDGVDPNTLGIPKTYTQKYYVELPKGKEFNALETTAGKVDAFDPRDAGNSGVYNGGGVQLYSPDAAKEAVFTPAK